MWGLLRRFPMSLSCTRSQHSEGEGWKGESRAAGIYGWCGNGFCDQPIGRLPTIGFFGIVACELPRLVNLNGFLVLPDDVGGYRFCLAAVDQEERALSRL